MTDTHNINIETKPQLDEIHKRLEDLKAAEGEENGNYFL